MDYLNDIFSQKEKLSRDFHQEHRERLEIIHSRINTNIYYVTRLAVEANHIAHRYYSADCLQLIDRALKLNIACLDSVNRLNFFEVAILSRPLIELCTTAIAISKDKELFEEFCSNNFESAKTIKIAKQYIPGIGKVWGDISNNVIHVNSSMHGSRKQAYTNGALSNEFRFTTLEIIVPNTKHAVIILEHIEMLTYLILNTIEIVFLDKAEHRGVEGYFLPNNTTFVIGESGSKGFQRLFIKNYSENTDDDKEIGV